MNDTLRVLIMGLVTTVATGIAAFGVDLTQEQAALVVGVANYVTLIVAYVWKSGQQASGTTSSVTASVTTTPETTTTNAARNSVPKPRKP